MFLKVNHYQWIMGIEEEQDFVVDVVNHKYDFKAISRIIQENIKGFIKGFVHGAFKPIWFLSTVGSNSC